MREMEPKPVQRDPIGLPRPKTRWIRSIVDLPIRLAERALGLDRIEELAKAVEFGDPSKPALERALDATGIIPRYAPEELARIPETGAVAVFANHPYGGADGALLAALAMRRRPDVKILANNILAVFPFMREHGILVDPFGGADAARRNAAALREPNGQVDDRPDPSRLRTRETNRDALDGLRLHRRHCRAPMAHRNRRRVESKESTEITRRAGMIPQKAPRPAVTRVVASEEY